MNILPSKAPFLMLRSEAKFSLFSTLLTSPFLSFPLLYYQTELRGRKIQNKLSGHKYKSKMQDPKHRIFKGQTVRLWFLFSSFVQFDLRGGEGKERKGKEGGGGVMLYRACAVFTLRLPQLSPSSAPKKLTVPLGYTGLAFIQFPKFTGRERKIKQHKR